jgi:3-deoxy-manno-octulosonate cytidylyltransferase (CMP-KDO synthetase)
LRVLGVVPARYGSTRFPGKALALLGGRPLVAHVIANARTAERLDRVIVATDDERIVQAARDAGAEAVMTPPGLPSGSDRVAHVLDRLARAGETYDAAVNIQGDEPFLPGEAIDRAVDLLASDPEAAIATLAVPAAVEDLGNANAVKVVLDAGGRALYFSRATIPYPRHASPRARWLKHVGLYAFRAPYLKRFVGLPPSGLEESEGLEQLRALEDGARIAVALGQWPVLGVDTPEDLAEAERRLAKEVNP